MQDETGVPLLALHDLAAPRDLALVRNLSWLNLGDARLNLSNSGVTSDYTSPCPWDAPRTFGDYEGMQAGRGHWHIPPMRPSSTLEERALRAAYRGPELPFPWGYASPLREECARAPSVRSGNLSGSARTRGSAAGSCNGVMLAAAARCAR